MCEEKSGDSVGSDASGIRSGVSVDHGKSAEDRKAAARDLWNIASILPDMINSGKGDPQRISS